jgi:pimeloyl-ACP methyl ester carboxylesterase
MVHGAFGGGWEWKQVATLLRERGHEVFTPSLTGHGERVHLATPEIGLETHIHDIANVLRYENLNEVILAGQSYGGMVMTGVADQMPERLSHLVYLNALVPEDGQTGFDLLPPTMQQRFQEAARATGDAWRIPPPPLENDPDVAAIVQGRFVPSLLRMFTDPIQLNSPPGEFKRTFIWCTEDPEGLTGVADLMKPFADRARRDPDWGFHQINSPPAAHIFHPQTVADLFDKAAQSH